jgi:SAM-dependent methyltransferase
MSENAAGYIHGYHARESHRLDAQAWSVLDLLHDDTRYGEGSTVLEVGCGTGAQTVTLARRSPGARFVCIDHSSESLREARERIDAAGLTNVELHQADLFSLPFPRESFDHAFVCFVLEHLPHPESALQAVRSQVARGGTVTAFEGDHGSAYFHPHSDVARRAVWCQVELQQRLGGNACVGREMYPLLTRAGFADVRVSPRTVYVDGSRPALAEQFTRRTFTGMIESVREPTIRAGLMTADAFDTGIRDLYRTAEPDGVFCYTFFKGVGTA